MGKRRGQNEGTIFEERRGRWVASISLGHKMVDGKRRRVRKKFVGATRSAVHKRLTEALREQQTGGIVPLQHESLGGYLRRFPQILRARGRAESTIASYEWIIAKYIEPEIGAIPLLKFTQVDLNDFMRKELEAGLSIRTVQYCHAIIRSALSKALKDGLVSRNVAKLAESPTKRGGSGSIEPLTLEEARRFLAAVVDHHLGALYLVALVLGLRRGEALGLEWNAVDLLTGTLTVTQTVKRLKGKGLVIERIGKTPKSLRMLPIPSFALGVLSEHRERQARERTLAGTAWREQGLVFTSTIGTPIEPRTLGRHFHATLKTLRIDRRRFHDLRHTNASLLLAEDATLFEVKEILGHSQISLTANLYGYAYLAAKREVLSRVDAILKPDLSGSKVIN